MNRQNVAFTKNERRWRYLKIPLLTIFALILVRVVFSFLGMAYTDNAFTVLRALIASAFLIESVQFINRKVDGYITWQEKPLKRFVTQFVLDLGFILFFTVILKLIVLIYIFHMELNSREEILITLAIVFISFIVVLADLGIFLVKRWGFSLAELEISKRENLQFRYEVLVSQINPHFLFNSLNTLTSLIYTDQEKAAYFTQQLSKVFRNVLELQENELIELREELNLAEAYINLMKIRFNESLLIIFEGDYKNIKACLPCMTIQLLIENAVNHNIISAKQILTINIYIENGCVVVKNNLQEKNLKIISTGIGLKNIAERYRMIGNRMIEIEKTSSHFVVKLPLIEVL